jgi:hypothetical protein
MWLRGTVPGPSQTQAGHPLYKTLVGFLPGFISVPKLPNEVALRESRKGEDNC